jgi:hypothetical protein
MSTEPSTKPSEMKNADVDLLQRIEVAIDRVTSGTRGLMTVPVDATDVDVVLSDASAEIARLRARIAELESGK